MEVSQNVHMAASQGLTYNPEDKPDFYSSKTPNTDQIMLDVKLWVRDVIASLSEDNSELFVFCDYGCSDGGKSVPVINEVIAQVRNMQARQRNILIIYEDQAENNFSAIFQKREERLLVDAHVFTLACGMGFYNQCLPSSFVNLGFCSFGAHWLSRKPCGLLNAMFVNDGGTEEELAQYAKVAVDDWNVFLLHRANELRSGGVIRIILATQTDGDSQTGSPRPVTSPEEGKLFYRITEMVRMDMFQEGLITEEERIQMSFGIYMREEDEIRAPFNNPDSPVRRAGLVLHAIHRKNYDCALHAKYREVLKEKGADIACREHAKAMVMTAKGPGLSTFMAALSHNRPQDEREKLLNTFFERYEQKVLEEPEQYGNGLCTFHVDIFKK